MTGRVDVLLRKIDEGVATVAELYKRDLDAQALSDDLRYVIRNVLQDCQSALDWTATAVVNRYATPSRHSPYFPLGTDPADFRAKLATQLPDLDARAPAVAAAIERHQPYQIGSEVLGDLHKLCRVNKHQDFSPQTRTETRRVRANIAGGGSVEWDQDAVTFGPGVFIGGVQVNPATQLPAPHPGLSVTKVMYVDWRFIDPPRSVLLTLQALARSVRETVVDVRTAASL